MSAQFSSHRARCVLEQFLLARCFAGGIAESGKDSGAGSSAVVTRTLRLFSSTLQVIAVTRIGIRNAWRSSLTSVSKEGIHSYAACIPAFRCDSCPQ
jgi:hypothetical protein